MYLIRLALRPWRQAPVSQICSSLAVGFLLVIAAFLLWLESGLKPVVARLTQEQVITAYLDSGLETKDEPRVFDQIRHLVGSSGVEVRMVGVQKFVEELKPSYPDLTRELESLGPEVSAVVPRYVTVAGTLQGGVLENVRKIPGVESAETSKDRHLQIVGAFKALRWVARLMAVGLFLALFAGLIHVSKMNGYLHRDSLNLMRLWGAGPLALRLPVILSGLWVGFWGGVIAWVGWIGLGVWLGDQIRHLSPMLVEMGSPTFALGAWLIIAGTIIGSFAGLLGVET